MTERHPDAGEARHPSGAEPARRILVLVEDRSLEGTVERLFRAQRFDLHRVPSAAGALLLAGNRAYDLIVVEGPVVGSDLYRFITQLRSLESPCTKTPVVIAAPVEHAHALAGALDQELVTVLPTERAGRELPRAVSWVLGVATRTSRRLLVQIRTRVGRSGSDQVVQTENVSASGMLLRGPRLPMEGSRIELSFTLPEEARPIVGEAEVVRHTDPAREGLTGAAVRFVRLESDGGERLRDHLEGRGLGRGRRGTLQAPSDAAAAR